MAEGITFQTWWPDTCGCSFEQFIDHSTPNPDAEFSFSYAACAAHPQSGNHNHQYRNKFGELVLCTGLFVHRPKDPTVFKGLNCPVGRSNYLVAYNENRLKNSMMRLAQTLIPYQHVFSELKADLFLVERLAPRIIHESEEIAAVDLLQKIAFIEERALERQATKLAQRLVGASYMWEFDDDRMLTAKFEIPLRKEQRALISQKTLQEFPSGKFKFGEVTPTKEQVEEMVEMNLKARKISGKISR